MWISFRIGALYLPSVLVLIFTSLIIAQLCRLSRARREMSVGDTSAEKNERQLRVMLLLVATSFIILRLPYSLCTIVKEANYHLFQVRPLTTKAKRIWLAFVCTNCVAAINYAINFFLFCFSGSLFRQKLYDCLACRKRTALAIQSKVTRFTSASSSPSIGKTKFRLVPTNAPPSEST